MRQTASLALLSLALFASAAASASAAEGGAEEVIKSAIAKYDVVIFSKSYCPYCKRAKAVFAELGVSPHVIELDQRGDGYAIQDAMEGLVGRRSVPQVFIHSQHVGGSDDTVAAYESGLLQQLLGIGTDEL